ncbi:MAG: anthranilate synthase component I family protein [Actinomycetota bacterium]
MSNITAPSRRGDRPGIVTHRPPPLGGAVLLVPVPETVRPERLLAALADRPWPVLARHGDTTVVASDPVETVEGPRAWDVLDTPLDPAGAPAPMAGGWIGLLADGLAGTVERLPAAPDDPGGPPAAALGRYESVALVDDAGRCVLATTGGRAGLRHLEDAVARMRPVADETPRRAAHPASSFTPGGYRDAVARIRELIAAGDCYQVNLTQRLTAPWTGTAPGFAHALWRAAGHAAYRAYLGLPGGVVASASPERLLRVRGGVASSEPIKGTAPRGATDLAARPKDRAEHVMIVDLVRNDLGRVARPGGVRVARLMHRLETAYVDHLVSEVVADLAPGTTPAAVLRAVFPGGSVTGAPKVRALEVIRDIEPVSRGPAFGSVVCVGRDGSVDAGITIRTAWLAGGEARYWCGGAVVWDSDPEAERLEAWAKAAPFLRAIGAA